MSVCLMAGAMALALAGPEFTLEWEHSVEKTRWRESWRVEDGGLRLMQAAVKGSGAGMEPGAGARLQGGWWVWQPDLPPVPGLVLAASGATGGGWALCSGPECHVIGARAAEPVTLRPCGDGDGNG